MNARQSSVQGQFQHLIYSPRGEIEGVLLQVEGRPLQIVFQRHDAESATRRGHHI